MNDNWYFDNITEDIIYGKIDSDGKFIKMMRELKRNLIIRKIANSSKQNNHLYPEVLFGAVISYQNKKTTKGVKLDENS